MTTVHTHPRFTQRLAQLEASPIRDILAVVDRPGMISFAGGMPAMASFPQLDLGRIPASAMQYGASEGDTALREQIAKEVQASGLNCTADQVLVLSGSQQGLDLVAKLFIDPGTPVAVETPTYLAALQVFRFLGARFVPLDRQAPVLQQPGDTAPALAYAIPTFQNPTGHCYSASERAALAAVCDAANVPLLEDDPYRDLAYEACARTPVCSLLRHAPWIYQGSFSKSLAPGLRLGYLVASPQLMPYLVRLKQAADLHSNRMSQWLVLQQLRDPARGERMDRVVDMYRRKRDAFARALDKHFQGLGHWQVPQGGLFFWLTLRQRIDTRLLLPLAIEQGVAFMPGESFYADRQGARGELRLNFSHAEEADIDKGLAVLAQLIREQNPKT
jgi:DNA-binding transcriptional MocR family regulator